MGIEFARIDDRLIHGQVAGPWTKHLRINRIIVVNDQVANSELQKVLLAQAAPPEVKANVVTVEKFIRVAKHPLIMDAKIMLLFKNPQDVLRVLKRAIFIPSVNVGGMKFTAGKQMLTHFISIDEADIAAFQALDRRHVELEIRKVPSDRKQYLMPLLKKGHFI